MLTGMEIVEQIKLGNIKIEPFSMDQLNPNSYNLTVADKVAYFTNDLLDTKGKNKIEVVDIPEDGYLLVPNTLYFVNINEYTETNSFIPFISGRSSIGRLGISVHPTANMGTNGYKGYWNFNIWVVRPVKIYPNMKIGQIYYYKAIGGEILHSKVSFTKDLYLTLKNKNLVE